MDEVIKTEARVREPVGLPGDSGRFCTGAVTTETHTLTALLPLPRKG